MTFGAEIWGPPLIAAGASWLSGMGGGGTPKETKMQKTQRKLVDQLINSLGGQGPYSSLYSTDEGAFQKSFVEPAQSMFRNQIAPQIQQQYIASGQQRGTGLEDQLLRAGVDLDSMLNQYLYQSQQDALNRQQSTIGSILGQGAGAPIGPSGGQNILAGLGGGLASPQFGQDFRDLFKDSQSTPASGLGTAGATTAPNAIPARKGFTPDWMDYTLGDSRWGNK